jgi:hypothetical protein
MIEDRHFHALPNTEDAGKVWGMVQGMLEFD